MAHALGIDRSAMLLQQQDLTVPESYSGLLARRVADEPVASLDPGNAEVVMKALQAAAGARGIPVLVSLHSLDLARRPIIVTLLILSGGGGGGSAVADTRRERLANPTEPPE